MNKTRLSLLYRLILMLGLCFWPACSSAIKPYTYLPHSDTEKNQAVPSRAVLKVAEGLTIESAYIAEQDWDDYFGKLGKKAVVFKNFLKEVSQRKEVRKLKKFYLFEIRIDNQTDGQAIFNPLNTFLKTRAGKWPAYTLTDLLMEENSQTLPLGSYKKYFFDLEILLSPGKGVKRVLIFKWPFEDFGDLTLIFHDIYLKGRSYDLKQRYDKIEIPISGKP